MAEDREPDEERREPEQEREADEPIRSSRARERDRARRRPPRPRAAGAPRRRTASAARRRRAPGKRPRSTNATQGPSPRPAAPRSARAQRGSRRARLRGRCETGESHCPSSKRRTTPPGTALLAAHLVDRRARLLVHRRGGGRRRPGSGASSTGVSPASNVVAVVAGGAGLGELRLQLVRTGRRRVLRLRRAAPPLQQRGRPRAPPTNPASQAVEAPHAADATVAAASCPVIAPFSPERRKQSGPIQTMGRKVIGTLTTYEILLMLDPEGAEAHQDEVIARVRELVEKGGGTWRSHDAWGRRRLAYEIAKKAGGRLPPRRLRGRTRRRSTRSPAC